MNAKNIIKALNTYSNNASDIECMIVYAFIKKENIGYENSDMLNDYVSKLDGTLRDKAVEYFSKTDLKYIVSIITKKIEEYFSQ